MQRKFLISIFFIMHIYFFKIKFFVTPPPKNHLMLGLIGYIWKKLGQCRLEIGKKHPPILSEKIRGGVECLTSKTRKSTNFL